MALGWCAKGHGAWWRKRERGRSRSPGWSVFCHPEQCLLFLSTGSPPFISSPSSGSILCIHKGLEEGIRACESVNTYQAKGNGVWNLPVCSQRSSAFCLTFQTFCCTGCRVHTLKFLHKNQHRNKTIYVICFSYYKFYKLQVFLKNILACIVSCTVHMKETITKHFKILKMSNVHSQSSALRTV